MIGVGVGTSLLAVSMGLSTPTFDPASLWSGGAQGVWLRPSIADVSFVDHVGQTPNPAANQTVGLLFDVSQGLARGPNLISNGDFTSGISGWSSFQGATLSHTGNALRIVGNGSLSFPGANQSISTILGRWYEVFYDCTSVSVGSVGVEISPNSTAGPGGFGWSAGGVGRKTTYGPSAAATMWVRPISSASNSDFVVDNVVAREIAGRHASQATVANRPLLRVGGNGVRFLENVSSDSLNWTAPAGTYTVAYVTPAGAVTILTGQALSGAVDVMVASQIVEYLAVNRALTTVEAAGVTAHLRRAAGFLWRSR